MIELDADVMAMVSSGWLAKCRKEMPPIPKKPKGEIQAWYFRHRDKIAEMLDGQIRLMDSSLTFLDSLEEIRVKKGELPSDPLDAIRQIRADRQAQYGDSLTDFTRTAALWSAILGTEVTPRDVALMMIALKLSRAKNSYKRDNMLDVMGYALCHEDLQKP